MRKLLFSSAAVLTFFFLLTTPKPAQACIGRGCIDPPKTLVTGVVKDSNRHFVSGAQVSVVCTHNLVNTTKTTTTNFLGLYFVNYPSSQCDDGDKVTITASKDGLTGTNTGIIKEKKCFMDIGFVKVVLVPEFGLLTGALAAISSTGALLFLKRKFV
jgi:hypothetical protein